MGIYSKNYAYIKQKYQCLSICQATNAAEVPPKLTFPCGRREILPAHTCKSGLARPLMGSRRLFPVFPFHSPYRGCATRLCRASHRHPLQKIIVARLPCFFCVCVFVPIVPFGHSSWMHLWLLVHCKGLFSGSSQREAAEFAFRREAGKRKSSRMW